ncbi:cation transporter [Nitratireductor sp. ac15]
MFRRILAATALIVMLSPFAVQAAERTIVLNVDKAACGLCAPIVKKTLSRVSGVKAVMVQEANGTSPAVATVTFDDAVINVATLIAASTNAGYPARSTKG